MSERKVLNVSKWAIRAFYLERDTGGLRGTRTSCNFLWNIFPPLQRPSAGRGFPNSSQSPSSGGGPSRSPSFWTWVSSRLWGAELAIIIQSLH